MQQFSQHRLPFLCFLIEISIFNGETQLLCYTHHQLEFVERELFFFIDFRLPQHDTANHLLPGAKRQAEHRRRACVTPTFLLLQHFVGGEFNKGAVHMQTHSHGLCDTLLAQVEGRNVLRSSLVQIVRGRKANRSSPMQPVCSPSEQQDHPGIGKTEATDNFFQDTVESVLRVQGRSQQVRQIQQQ